MKLKILSRRLLGAVLAAAPLAAPAAAVQVEFTDPAKFTDVGRSYSYRDEVDDTLAQLKRHLVDQANRLLPGDEKLDVTVTDIDLAGSFEPWQRYSREVRVVRRTYPPRIDLTFRLSRGDTVLKEGARSLRDAAFLDQSLRYRDDALGHEKQLLDDWLRHEFVPAR
jgi:hypothetical protein